MALNIPACPRECPKRAPGCHATCREYIDKTEEYQAQKAAIVAAKKRNNDWTAHKTASRIRRLKSK